MRIRRESLRGDSEGRLLEETQKGDSQRRIRRETLRGDPERRLLEETQKGES